VDLDVVAVDLQLVDQEALELLALVTLELDHLASLVVDDGAIAGKLLLDNLENLLEVQHTWQSLHGGQSLASIALLDAYVDLLLDLSLASVVPVDISEGIEGLEIFDFG